MGLQKNSNPASLFEKLDAQILRLESVSLQLDKKLMRLTSDHKNLKLKKRQVIQLEKNTTHNLNHQRQQLDFLEKKVSSLLEKENAANKDRDTALIHQKQLQEKVAKIKSQHQEEDTLLQEERTLKEEIQIYERMIRMGNERLEREKENSQIERRDLIQRKENHLKRLRSLKETEILIRTEGFLNVQRQNSLRDELKI